MGVLSRRCTLIPFIMQSNCYTTGKECVKSNKIGININFLKNNNVKNTELSYQEIEELQFLLRMHMEEYKNVMPELTRNNLEKLKVKLIAMRGALEKQTTIKN